MNHVISNAIIEVPRIRAVSRDDGTEHWEIDQEAPPHDISVAARAEVWPDPGEPDNICLAEIEILQVVARYKPPEEPRVPSDVVAWYREHGHIDDTLKEQIRDNPNGLGNLLAREQREADADLHARCREDVAAAHARVADFARGLKGRD